MHTKGVASVRSPVRNLVQSSASVTHDAFVGAVIQSFREEYTIDEEVSQFQTSFVSSDAHLHSRVSSMRRSNTLRMNSLESACPNCRQVSPKCAPTKLLTDPLVQSWDWAYGQTPEFEYAVSNTFQWGELVRSHSHAIHGTFSLTVSVDVHHPLETWNYTLMFVFVLQRSVSTPKYP